MARDFVRDTTGGVLDSDHFRADVAAVTGPPFTVEGWVFLRDLAAVSQMWWCGDKDATDQYFGVMYIPNGVAGAPNNCFCANARAGSQAFAFSSVAPSVDTWHHFAAVFESNTKRTIYIDGAGAVTDTTDVAPSGLDRTALGVSGDANPDSPLAGLLAEVRVWDGALSAAHIATLAAKGAPTFTPQEYVTTFDGTEDPISEGGEWTMRGETEGGDWSDCAKAGGIAFGTHDGVQFADPTALLGGTWWHDQEAEGVIHGVGVAGSCSTEVELRVLSEISTGVNQGYEGLWSLRDPDPGPNYMQIVRWNGDLGDFDVLATLTDGPTPQAGDVFSMTVVRNGAGNPVITLFVNAVQKLQVEDTEAAAFVEGNPGMGFYIGSSCLGDLSAEDEFGFTSFAARELLPELMHTWGLCEGETGNAVDAVGSLDLTEFSVNGGAIGDAAHPTGLSGSVCSGGETTGSATGALVFAGSATATAAISGQTSAALAFAGTAAAMAAISGASAQALAFGGSSTGVVTGGETSGSSTRALLFGGSVTGLNANPLAAGGDPAAGRRARAIAEHLQRESDEIERKRRAAVEKQEDKSEQEIVAAAIEAARAAPAARAAVPRSAAAVVDPDEEDLPHIIEYLERFWGET